MNAELNCPFYEEAQDIQCLSYMGNSWGSAQPSSQQLPTLTRAGQAVAVTGGPVVLAPSLQLAQTMESSTNTAFTPSSYTCTQEHRCGAFSNSTNTCNKWTEQSNTLA